MRARGWIGEGWPPLVSSLKTLLETGDVLPVGVGEPHPASGDERRAEPGTEAGAESGTEAGAEPGARLRAGLGSRAGERPLTGNRVSGGVRR
ncbi:hypothetical protein AB1484_25435 [Parafrankia sp. FMc6]|uniref:hypothetical protein n=1 Tax=Parafrankia soli TaxID=2599596 RepID=UPI0034D49306